MFGRGWEKGMATVITRESDTDTHRYGVNVEVASDRYHNGYIYIADIEPESGKESFRATFRERFSHTNEFHEPHVGERLPVKFNSKDEKVEFDRSVLRDMEKASKASKKDHFEAIGDSPPGSDIPPR